MADPVFPLEIEYLVFTNALALKKADDPLNLFLVAKRIHTWLVPEYMRSIAVQEIVDSKRYPKSWNPEVLETYGKHVRHLLIWSSEPFIGQRYLTLCPNLTALNLWITEPVDLEAISALPLTHLSMDLANIGKITPHHISLFSKITHLEAIYYTPSQEYDRGLAHFTSLTHLAIPESRRNSDVAILFQQHPTLEVLVLYLQGDKLGVQEELSMASDGRDPRVVIQTYANGSEIEDWLLDVQEGRGLWGLADDAIRERNELKGIH